MKLMKGSPSHGAQQKISFKGHERIGYILYNERLLLNHYTLPFQTKQEHFVPATEQWEDIRYRHIIFHLAHLKVGACS